MKKLYTLLALFIISLVLFSLILNPSLFFENITKTLQIWLYKVYPSIFTFYLISSFLINTKIINRIIYLLRPILKHLRFINDDALHLFILSVFIGNPSSSSLIVGELKKTNINKNDAKLLLASSSSINPLFIISFLSLYSLSYAMLILVVHSLSNLIIAIYNNRHNSITTIKKTAIDFKISELLDSFNKVVYLLLMISSVMVFANLFKYSITTTLSFFDIKSNIINLLLANVEISTGINQVLKMNYSLFITLLLISILSAFGGLSIHLQVINVISEVKLSYLSYFKNRLIQVLLSIILMLLLYRLFIN